MRIILICGVHGDEQNAIKVCKFVADKYKNAEVKVLEESESARIGNTRCDKNGIDWNRNGHAINSIDYRKFDVFLDVHCSPNLTPCVVIDNDMYAKNYVQFCDANDIPYAITDVKNTIKNNIKKLGIPAFTVELNGMGITNRSTFENNCNFMYNIIESLDKTKDVNAEFVDDPKGCVDFTDMMVNVKMNFDLKDKEKIFALGKTNPGGFYTKGEAIMSFASGEKITAPANGWVIDYNDCPYAYLGNDLFEFQKKLYNFYKC